MIITCPECQFQRSVDEKQIPAAATVVTCPKCTTSFYFRNPETGEFEMDICSFDQDTPVAHVQTQNERSNASDNQAVASDNQSVEQKNNTLRSHGEIQEQVSDSSEPKNTEHESVASQATETETQDTESVIHGEDRQSLKEDEVTKDIDSNIHNDSPLRDKNEQNEENSFTSPRSQRRDENEGQESFKKENTRFQMMTDDVPWEHPDRYGIVGSLFQTVVRVMFRAPDFFKTIHSQNSMLRPATFYALLGLFQTLCLQMWLSSFNTVDILSQNPQMGEVVSQFSAPMTIILAPFMAVFQLLLYSAFLYLAIRITNPDKADYNLIIRIVGYGYAPTILSVVPYIGPMIGLVWFVCNIFIGIKYALNLSWQRTILALSPIFILWIFIIMSSLGQMF